MDVKRHKAYQKAPLESRRQSPTKWNTLPIYGGRAFECAPSGKRRLRPSEQNLLRRAKRKGSKWQFRISDIIPGTPALRPRITRRRCHAPHCHAPRPCPVVRSRRRAHRPCSTLVRHGSRARCPHRPWRLATRAAAPSARCAAWHPAPLPGRRGLPDAAPCAAIGGARRRPSKTLSVCYLPLPMAHYPGGAMGTSRPTAITHARIARGGSPLRGGFADNAQKVACTKDSTGIPSEPDVARPAYTTAARPMLPGNRRARTRRLSAISS